MSRKTTGRVFVVSSAMAVATVPAYAHVGIGVTSSFSAGFMHPLTGLDHLTVMVAVGLWAAIKGGRALWVWPAAFVSVMLAGAGLGMAHIPLPFVEPGILASVVVLGLLVALAVDLPISAGVAIIGLFALLHGHAHGVEIPESAGGFDYVAGFALATAMLHGVGLAAGLAFGVRSRLLARVAGAVCAALGVALAAGAF